jgi:hypothetical protein
MFSVGPLSIQSVFSILSALFAVKLQYYCTLQQAYGSALSTLSIIPSKFRTRQVHFTRILR